MGIFGKKKALIQQLQNAVALQNAQIAQLQENNEHLKQELESLRSSIPKEQKDFEILAEKSKALKEQIADSEKKLNQTNEQIAQKADKLDSTASELHTLYKSLEEKAGQLQACVAKIQKAEVLYSAYKSANRAYIRSNDTVLEEVYTPADLMPIVEIELNCMGVKDLRKLYNHYQSSIRKTFQRYEGRYTTKSNIAIYQLMVIAMEAELQNILHAISYGKLESSIEHVKSIINRYYEIAVEGNQSIAPTMKKFIAEIEDLFIGVVKVEYEYYVKKEQIKEEQRALREQMKQEEEERKALEAEKKKVEKEESKYANEIQQLKERVQDTADDSQTKILLERIQQLQEQLSEVQKKKEDIVNLQNGKAGYVYVISNLGAFGDDVFKVGMTRRLEPMDRIKELSNASVPFSFDVHSFIFSDDAVGLEKMLHQELNDKRVNKINLRKEFFRTSIDELEQLVLKHYPSAEFKKTMLAEQYYQSQSMDKPLEQADLEDA
ncbi:GIY-YIG nuclease family protein [uncultured Ruminococcus sp.]|uniref:GIY-YIG nuclease family protein n=1 Tax=uncultured Ruminococcus sp. TaxID=165186 RepID=UPI00267535A2|nr:GIY-YIG nuclease family protein [uncultured Ruminococcus sp.]